MSTTAQGFATTPREKLTRKLILRSALAYVDRSGLDALSMHKLGAELGVKAMSLYNHVANKDDVLSGIADVLWSEVAAPPSASTSWQDVAQTLAGSLRAMIRRHPNAAHLLVSCQTLSEHSLRVADTYRTALAETGLPDECAVPLVRTLVSYTLGQTLAELSWSQALPAAGDADELARIRRVSDLLPPGASDGLVRTALWFCVDFQPAEQFDLGITLMLKGLDAHLAEARLSSRSTGSNRRQPT